MAFAGRLPNDTQCLKYAARCDLIPAARREGHCCRLRRNDAPLVGEGDEAGGGATWPRPCYNELGAVDLTPEQEVLDRDLEVLLPLLAALAGASLNKEAEIYVNQIIKASSRAVLLRAGESALETHPQFP